MTQKGYHDRRLTKNRVGRSGKQSKSALESAHVHLRRVDDDSVAHPCGTWLQKLAARTDRVATALSLVVVVRVDRVNMVVVVKGMFEVYV